MDTDELKELKSKYKGCSIKEFRENLNLSKEQKELIKEQLNAIKYHFCITDDWESTSHRLAIIHEMMIEFDVR